MRAGEWSSQIRRGTLELCVLALIAGKPRYGYDLVSALERWEPGDHGGTVYPLLRRRREGNRGLVASPRRDLRASTTADASGA